MNKHNYELKMEYSNRQAFHYPTDLKEAIEILAKDEYAILTVTAPNATNEGTVDLMQLTQKDLKGRKFEGIEAAINQFADDARNASKS